MNKSIGTSAGVIALAAAIVFHGSPGPSEATTPTVTTTVAGNAAPLAASGSEPEGPAATIRAYFNLRPSDPLPSSRDIQSLIVSIPDPQQTRLALFADAAVNAIQQAAFDAHWELATQWMPWRSKGAATTKDAGTLRKTSTSAHSQEQQPGLLIFRHSESDGHFDAKVLFVFLVGETPTAGLNADQFRSARTYMTSGKATDIVHLVTPCFSGSIHSLKQLIDAERSSSGSPRHHFSISSGTATSSLLLTAFAGVPDVDVHGTSLNNASDESRFLGLLRSLRIPLSEAAVLVEDESAFSKDISAVARPQDSERPLVLRYPRDISHLRNVYHESAGVVPTSKLSSADIDFSLKDQDSGEDSLPMFSSEKTPVAQNAILGEITAQIRREGIRLVKVSATNILDLLFLAKVLRVQCPDTRVLITSPDLLFVRESQNSPLRGILALSTYPLFSAAKRWLGEHPVTHSSSNEEAIYYAVQLSLLSPDEGPSFRGYAWKGQPYPASWLMTLTRQGFLPVRLVKQTADPKLGDNWFQPVKADRVSTFSLPRPPATWTLALSLLTLSSLLVSGWILYMHHNPCVLSWSIVAPDGRHIADAHRLLCVVAALLLLVTMQGVLLIPLGYLCFSAPYLFQTMSPLVPVTLCLWLTVRILREPRCTLTRWIAVLVTLATPLLILGTWLLCCYRQADQAGFFFSFRALEMQTGSSPAIPILLLLLALFVCAIGHLVRFFYAISHRPRLFVAQLDSFFHLKMHNCRKELNRILVAPMNFRSRHPALRSLLYIAALGVCFATWRAQRKLSSFEGISYDLLLLGLVAVVILALAVTTIQTRLAWAALQPLLTRLNTLPFRSAFTRIAETGKGGPIWAKRLNLQSLAMPTSAVTLLRNLEVLSLQPEWNYSLTREDLRAAREHYSQVLGILLENHASRRTKQLQFCILRFAGAALTHTVTERILIPEWKLRVLPTEAIEVKESKPAEPAIDAYHVAQAFVALQISGFLNYGVRQIQNLVFAISFAFGLLVIALNLYPSQSPQAINRLLLGAAALLGYSVWKVLSQMERDPVLSQLGGTDEGKLNRDFYLKFIGYSAGSSPQSADVAIPFHQQFRFFLAGAFAGSDTLVVREDKMASLDNRNEYLQATASLDVQSPLITEKVAHLVQGTQNEVERALRIHGFVRDQIRFGWVPQFDRQTASQTLASGVGFCNTKTPLFVTMLRAAGIPARIHFVGINKDILAGLLDPVARFVDHCFAEVFLGGKWLKVDSYIVDAPLYRKAMAKLRFTTKLVGFGLHRHGTSTWDGRTDSFAQFLNDGTSPQFSDRDFGIHTDLDAFYASGQARMPNNPVFRRGILPALLFFGNRKTQALRNAI